MTDPGARRGIVTPEGVVLSFDEAGLGSRALAFVLDLLVRALAAAAVFLLAAMFVPSLSALIVVYVVVVFALLLVYPAAFETATGGRTPGKTAVGLRVVTVEGSPIRFRHAVIRSALGLIDFGLTTGVAAVACAVLTRRSQRLGDLVAGTMVVRERSARPDTVPLTFAPVPGWENFTESLNTSGLTGEMVVLVRDFLVRAGDFDTESRWRLGSGLADRVAERTGTPVPPGGHPEAYLVSVVAAHQNRGPSSWQAPAPPPVAAPTGVVDDLPPTWGT